MTQYVLLFDYNTIIQLVSPQEKRRHALLSVLPPPTLQIILFNNRHLHSQLLWVFVYPALRHQIWKLVSGGPAISG